MTLFRRDIRRRQDPPAECAHGRTVPRARILTPRPTVDQCVTDFWKKGTQNRRVEPAGRARAAQRDGSPGEPERRSCASCTRRGAAVALGARRPHRSDPQRDPRPHRRAGRERTRVGERAAPLGTPGRPSPLVSPEPDGAIGPGPRHRGRLDRGGHRRPRRRGHRRDPGRPAAAALVGRRRSSPTSASWPTTAPGRRSSAATRGSAIGVAVVGVVRRSDGFVSMAPNLGWVDVAARRRARPHASATTSRSTSRTRPTWAPSRKRAGAPPSAPTTSCSSRARSASAAGIIVDGEPFTGAAGYGGEVGHMPVNPAGLAVPLRLDRLLGDRGRLAEPPAAGRPGRRPAAADAIDALLARGRRRAHPSPWAPSRRPAAGSGSAWPASSTSSIPRLVVLGGLFGRIHPFVGRIVEAELDRRALAAPATPRADRPGDARRRGARCSARRSSRSSRSSPIRPGWMRPRGDVGRVR